MIVLFSPELPPYLGGIAGYIQSLKAIQPSLILQKLTSLNYLSLFRRLWRYRSADEWWIHHILPVGTVAYVAGRLGWGRPYRVFLHGMDWDLARRNSWKQQLSTKIILSAKEVVTNSQALKRDVLAAIPQAKVRVVHPTITPDRLAAGLATPARAPHSGLTRVLSVSRLVERKGLHLLVDALVKLPQVHLTIIGDGPERERLLALAERLGVAKRLDLRPGVVGRAYVEAYREADVFALTPVLDQGAREGFGIVYLEAAAFALPVIASNQPGIKEAVIEGETGLLIEPTVEKIVQAISLLAKNRDLATRFGEAGQKRAAHFATLDRMARELNADL